MRERTGFDDRVFAGRRKVGRRCHGQDRALADLVNEHRRSDRLVGTQGPRKAHLALELAHGAMRLEQFTDSQGGRRLVAEMAAFLFHLGEDCAETFVRHRVEPTIEGRLVDHGHERAVRQTA